MLKLDIYRKKEEVNKAITEHHTDESTYIRSHPHTHMFSYITLWVSLELQMIAYENIFFV